MSTDAGRRAASKAMSEGWYNCRRTNYFGVEKPCNCDFGAVDGCKARLEAIAVAIDAARSAAFVPDERSMEPKAP